MSNMTIPQVREELLTISNRLAELVAELHRRPYVRKVMGHSTPMNEVIEADIHAYAKAHPSMTYMELGHAFGVSVGRISEVLAGKRGE